MDCSRKLRKFGRWLMTASLLASSFMTASIVSRPAMGQTAFGFQDNGFNSNQFGTASNWTNGFSQAFLQLQPLSNVP